MDDAMLGPISKQMTLLSAVSIDKMTTGKDTSKIPFNSREVHIVCWY